MKPPSSYVSFVHASRWQIKVAAVECTIQALRLINEATVSSADPLDLKRARLLVRQVGTDGRSAVLSSPQVSLLWKGGGV